MDLTRRLLAFSRKQVLDTRPMNLNDEVSATADLLRRVIGEDVGVTLHLDADIGKIRADATQIQQVLMNLALNARDAMPDGGKLIIETANVMLMEHLVRGFPGVKPGSYIMLTVSDTGQGMDEQVQRRIFEPFFTTKGPGKGTGLGLAIVMGVVHQHEGHLEVDSQRGLGTTFKLYFPRLPDEAPLALQNAATNQRAMGRETVLVAEDEPAVRQMACRVLETHGYTVLEAPDGPTAEQLFHTRADSIQLLLTDVMMPEMNGMELYRRLSSLRSGLKVLFMTGYAHDLLERYGKEGLEVPVLNKPFTIAHLTQKVREVLDG
jgi:CheY-like chemotaxis protein